MKLDGRRESQNVDDRRHLSGGAKAGMGIGGIIIAALFTWFMGGNPLSVLQNVDMNSLSVQTPQGQRQATPEEEELARRMSQSSRYSAGISALSLASCFFSLRDSPCISSLSSRAV